MNEAIARIMKGLHCSEAEAKAIYEADKAIDRNEPMPFDLTAEQKKVAKKYTSTGTKAPTVYKYSKRKTHKENPTKAAIIAELFDFLTKNSENACENVEITNKERQIAFKCGENAYELTLVQKRK